MSRPENTTQAQEKIACVAILYGGPRPLWRAATQSSFFFVPKIYFTKVKIMWKAYLHSGHCAK